MSPKPAPASTSPEQHRAALCSHRQVDQLVSVQVQTGTEAAAKVLEGRGDGRACDTLRGAARARGGCKQSLNTGVGR